MEDKSIERIAEELGGNFYDLHPLIVKRDKVVGKAGMRKVVEWIEARGVFIDTRPWGPLSEDPEWQAKLKEWGL